MSADKYSNNFLTNMSGSAFSAFAVGQAPLVALVAVGAQASLWPTEVVEDGSGDSTELETNVESDLTMRP